MSQFFISLFVALWMGFGLILPCQALAESSKDLLYQSPNTLTIRQAIDIALENNFDLLLANERILEAKGTESLRLGALLPNLSGDTNVRNLKTFQGEFGGRPAVSTPRDIYDLRGRLTQSIFSLSLIQRWIAGRVGVAISETDVEVAKRDTIATIALLYFDAVRAEESVEARKANVTLSQALLKMAEGRKAAGAATGIDVTRAQVQYHTDKQRLLTAETERNRAKLDLVRAMGVQSHAPFHLTDKLQYSTVRIENTEKAMTRALAQRREIQAQKQRIKLAKLNTDSIKSERVPALDFRGDYGLIGQEFDRRFATYNVGAFLSIPLFDGGQREGRLQESNSQLRQEMIRTQNLVHQIRIEVQDALLSLGTSQQQVLVTQEGLSLALKELRLSRKAFSLGTLTHLEVINAQTAVAEARDRAIGALFAFNAARVNLARAQGQIEDIYQNPKHYVQRTPRSIERRDQKIASSALSTKRERLSFFPHHGKVYGRVTIIGYSHKKMT